MRHFLFIVSMLVASILGAQAQTPGAVYAISSGSRSLFVEDAKLSNGSPVVLWTKTDVAAQQWRILQGDNGLYLLESLYPGKYLATPTSPRDGAKLTGSTIRRNCFWQLIPVQGKNGIYKIVSSNGKFVVCSESEEEGAQPVLRPYAETSPSTEWVFQEISSPWEEEFSEKVRDRMMTGFIGHYYKPGAVGYCLGSGGFWSDAEMIETILDAYETTGNSKYMNYYTQLMNNFLYRQGNRWGYNPFNDDIAWMVLACLRGYKYFNVEDYLAIARENFTLMYDRAIQPSGTLRWSQDASDHGSNSCINGPATIALCYLYELTGEEDYLQKAKNLWEVQYNSLSDKNDGHTWDSGEWSADWSEFKVGNYWGSTYNQGTMLGASVKLYVLTGDEKYLRYADKVYSWAYESLTAKESPRVINACQTATGDLSGFKGILVRYVRLYAEISGNEKPMQWLADNAWHAYQNSNSKGVIWSKWLSKTPENFQSIEGNEIKDFSNDAFGASTAVSVAFNAHVNGLFSKDAYTPVTARNFDDIKWMQLATRNNEVTNGGVSGSWLCFRNVDFGEDAPQSVFLTCKGASQGALAVYADKISPDCRIAVTPELDGDWTEYSLELTTALTGKHNIYVMNVGEGNGAFNKMVFSHNEATVGTVEQTEILPTEETIYDLWGRKVNGVPPSGIYVSNGRKFIVR